jgi:hypothetical protein
MMRTYEDVKAEAQKLADATGFDVGLEANPYTGYSCFMLPQKTHRHGHELRCEVVHCTDLAKCRPGHGPLAVDPNPAPTYHGGPRK